MDVSMEEKVLQDVRARIQVLREKEVTGLGMNEEAELTDLEAQQEYLQGIIEAKKKETELQTQEQNQSTPIAPNIDTANEQTSNSEQVETQWTDTSPSQQENPSVVTIPVEETNQTANDTATQSPTAFTTTEDVAFSLEQTFNHITILLADLDHYKESHKVNRPFSLAVTKLEEAQMWLAKSIDEKNHSNG